MNVSHEARIVIEMTYPEADSLFAFLHGATFEDDEDYPEAFVVAFHHNLHNALKKELQS